MKATLGLDLDPYFGGNLDKLIFHNLDRNLPILRKMAANDDVLVLARALVQGTFDAIYANGMWLIDTKTGKPVESRSDLWVDVQFSGDDTFEITAGRQK